MLEIVNTGGNPFYVGGKVRDEFLEIENKDHDLEVYNLSPEQLMKVLSKFGNPSYVGKFAIVKLRYKGEEIDFALPRLDNKTGSKHTDFEVKVDHNLSPKEAAKRRDFTINAISKHAITGEIVDPFNGLEDLNKKILRATSDQFDEDPLRVLRGFQFASRFKLTAEEDLISRCEKLFCFYDSISVERVGMEWDKWALKGVLPSAGLQFLVATGWIKAYPELEALLDCPQDPEWHPEGDVFVHTMHVCDAAASIAARENLRDDDRRILMFAALCHDLGKATTTEFKDGRWRAHGHCEAGVELSGSLLSRIHVPKRIIEKVKPLVAEHLAHVRKEVTRRNVRRLAVRLHPAKIEQLMMLIEADMGGRPPLPGGMPPQSYEILDIAKDMKIEEDKPESILRGKHLMAEGFYPNVQLSGPEFGEILKKCYQAQLDGVFEDEETGKEYLKQILG